MLDQILFDELVKLGAFDKFTYQESLDIANKHQASYWPFWQSHNDLVAKHFFTVLCDYTEFETIELNHLDHLNSFILSEPGRTLFQNNIIPIQVTDNQIEVVISAPHDIEWIRSWQQHQPYNVLIKLCRLNDFLKYKTHLTIDLSYQSLTHKQSFKDTHALSKIVAYLMHYAIAHGISDIHGEPQWNNFQIRMRSNGLLQHSYPFDNKIGKQITNCLKILSHCDVANSRLPQDGYLGIEDYPSGKQDARINFCPTLHGEKWVIRLLPQNRILPLNELGFFAEDLKKMQKAISQPQGLILITGPTGSGKTTTLYALLETLNTHRINISTIEDPIEKQIPQINQIQINSAIGFDFATGLKALLRQDPDVIMIGEIRDKATADIALKASQTGHLVLATLHSNSTAHTISRLLAMGFHPELLSQTMIAIVAQRLARQLCQHCKNKQPCKFCNDGYATRLPIYEVMSINASLRTTIEKKPFQVDLLERKACELGMHTLKQSAQMLIDEGITDRKEINRVIFH